MPRYRIDISYDGTEYVGWQIQPNGMTIQQRIQEVLLQLTGEQIKVHGSGRTDQGVHARKQVAHFDLQKSKQAGSLVKGLNALLPGDIRIRGGRVVRDDFHARRSATGKEYRYFIWNADIVPPNLRLYRTHIRHPLDTDRMNKAASYLAGRHDFTSFTANAKQVIPSTVRNLTKLEVRKHGSEVVILAASEGFLYKMVRSLAGFLIKAGEGSVTPASARTVLCSRKRTAHVRTARPEGLFLWDVWYPSDFQG